MGRRKPRIHQGQVGSNGTTPSLMKSTQSKDSSRFPNRPMFYGYPDPIALNKMEGMVANIRTMERERFQRGIDADPRRDLNAECGYPETRALVSEDYKDLIDREPTAAIVNEVYPVESWQTLPTVYEKEAAKRVTPFEVAWDSLSQQMGPEPSYYSEEGSSSVYATLLLADILTGEGRHGALLLGLDDGKELWEPASPRSGQRLTYLRAFPEYQCRVTSFETDPKNPRYGYPTQYMVMFSDPRDTTGSGVNENYMSQTVHWSRIVHLTDRWHQAVSSVNFGIPRIRPVLNPVLDIRKVRGASAEMYYKGAFFGMHFGTHPQLGADVTVDTQSLKDMYEEYQNGLQRGIFTNGMTVDPLAPSVVDPSPQIMVQIDAISIKTRVPRRILLGGDLGDKSSQEDKIRWHGRLRGRVQQHNIPDIVVPFVNRCINLGVLPTPPSGYKVDWPDVSTQSDQDRATALYTRTQAYALYVSSDMERVVPPMDYMTKFDTMTEEEAEVITDAAEQAQEETEGDNQALADQHGLVPDVEGFHDKPADPVEVAKAKAGIKTSADEGDEADNSDSLSTMLNNFVVNPFCKTGKGGGVDPHCGDGKGAKAKGGKGGKGKSAAPPKEERGPSTKENRNKENKPPTKEWKDPPAPTGQKGTGKAVRPKGDRSQTKLGDKAEETSLKLGFRNILPEGQRSHKPGENKTKGSTIDTEYDHSGRAYEVKMCKTSATEYRAKPKKEEIADKLKYAKKNGLTAYTMIAVMDEGTRQIHYYGAKEKGISTKKLSKDNFDYFGSEKY